MFAAKPMGALSALPVDFCLRRENNPIRLLENQALT